MKKRRILYLLPFTTLLLGGCTFNDVKSWVGQNIYFPIRNWIDGYINPGKQDKPQTEEKLTEKALLEAVDKSLAPKNYTADIYSEGAKAYTLEYDDPSQLMSGDGYYLYYEVVDNVTYAFVSMDKETWYDAGSEQGNVLGLGFSKEDLEELLHSEYVTVEYGKDYCLATYSEDAALAQIIAQYPDYEAQIRAAYQASEVKNSMKFTVSGGYIASYIENTTEVVLDTASEETAFVCNSESTEFKFSKIGQTMVDRPTGIDAIPPEETGSEGD